MYHSPMAIRSGSGSKTEARGTRRPQDEAASLDRVLRTLRDRQSELRRLGVEHLSVFGSMARGEAEADSDVDLLVDLDPKLRIDIFDLNDIAARIEGYLDAEVDLIRRHRIAGEFRERALRDEIVVF